MGQQKPMKEGMGINHKLHFNKGVVCHWYLLIYLICVAFWLMRAVCGVHVCMYWLNESTVSAAVM